MGYQVTKDGKHGNWRVVWQKDHGKGNREQQHIGKGTLRFRELGFRAEMTIDEARAVAAKVRAEEKIKQQALRLQRLDERLQKEALILTAFMPADAVAEFEAGILKDKKIRLPHWNTAKKLIAALDFPPNKWFGRCDAIYNLFIQKKFSPDYSRTLLRIMNIWGWFYCDKYEKAWKDVPFPKGQKRTPIINAYRKRVKGGRDAAPLTPELLESLRSETKPEHFRWLWISLWLGLRPREVNNLKTKSGLWKIDSSDPRFKILLVYQQKLEADGVEPERCWKAIPAIFPEQSLALEIIERGDTFIKPSYMWYRKRGLLDKKIKPYSGRKGFMRILQERGFNKDCRMKWMGHISEETGAREYEDPRIVTYFPPVKEKKTA